MKILSPFKVITLYVILVFLGTSYGCHRYKVSEKYYEQGGATLSSKQLKSNFFVLHVGEDMWEIKNAQFTTEKITGSLHAFGGKERQYFDQYNLSGTTKVDKKDRSYVEQVHIYAMKYSGDSTNASVEVADAIRIESMKYSSGKAIVIPIVVVGVLVLAVAGLVVVCNCPHVYVDDGETYYYNNTLFTGANYPALERDDYKLMPDYFSNSKDYHFVIKNEENENQFTNLLELLVIEHHENEQILSDQNGKLYTVSNEVKAVKNIGDTKQDLDALIGYNDDNSYSFDNKTEEDYSHVYSTFESPKNSIDANLIIRLKNSQWAGLVYNEFNQLLGKHYSKWQDRNLKKSSDELNQIRKDGGIPLVVSVKSYGKWIDIESIDPVGDANYNTLIVPIDEQFFSKGEEIEVRLRSGFMFWDLDYIAMDFSPQKELNVQYLKPSIVNDKNGADFRAAVNQDDDLYLESLQKGDSTYIEFEGLNVSSTLSRTIILHSKGYYLQQLQYEGKANRKELVKFKETGEMSRFSRDLYIQYYEAFADKSE